VVAGGGVFSVIVPTPLRGVLSCDEREKGNERKEKKRVERKKIAHFYVGNGWWYPCLWGSLASRRF